VKKRPTEAPAKAPDKPRVTHETQRGGVTIIDAGPAAAPAPVQGPETSQPEETDHD